MISLVIYNRVDRDKPTRVKVEGISVQNNVKQLKHLVKKCTDTDMDIELLYGGQMLKDDVALSEYDLKEGVTVHAVRKPDNDMDREAEVLSRAEIQQVTSTIQTALSSPVYRNTVEKLLANPETLQTLLATSPGLQNDPMAIAMLQDPELLAQLAEPSVIWKVIERHPSLGHAAKHVAAAVSKEAAKVGRGAAGGSNVTRGAHYSLDQMSDDEDMDDQPAPNPQGITTNQLGAALAALANQMGPPPGGPSGSTSSAGSSAGGAGSGGMITSDFFRQAMESASGSSAQVERQVSESDMQQLREMGITDESVARRALEASGGDVQAALEIIFGDGLM